MDCVQCVSQRSGSFSFCRGRSLGGWISLISRCQAMMEPSTRTSAMRWPWRWCTWSMRKTRWDSSLSACGDDIGRLLWIRPSLTVFSCSVTSCFLTGPPWGPCLRSDVRRSGAQLARSVNIVGPCEATDGQGLRYFCEESPEVDGTCRGVQQRTLWQGNTLNIDLRKVHSSWKTDE